MKFFDNNDPKEWLYDRCIHDGAITLDKKQFTQFFPGNVSSELVKLHEFCKRKNLTLAVDKERQKFTFTLKEPDLRGF
jgi:hypothetical protein